MPNGKGENVNLRTQMQVRLGYCVCVCVLRERFVEGGRTHTHQNHGQLPEEGSYYWFAGCLTGGSYALIHTCAHIHKCPLMWEHAHTHTSATHTTTFLPPFPLISFLYVHLICFELDLASFRFLDLLIILFSALALQLRFLQLLQIISKKNINQFFMLPIKLKKNVSA